MSCWYVAEVGVFRFNWPCFSSSLEALKVIVFLRVDGMAHLKWSELSGPVWQTHRPELVILKKLRVGWVSLPIGQQELRAAETRECWLCKQRDLIIRGVSRLGTLWDFHGLSQEGDPAWQVEVRFPHFLNLPRVSELLVQLLLRWLFIILMKTWATFYLRPRSSLFHPTTPG